MVFSEEEIGLFYELDWALMYYANQKYRVIHGLAEPNFKGQSVEDIFRLKQKIFSGPGLIDSFVAENPLRFNGEKLAIVESWKNFVAGDFFVVQHRQDYSVFLQAAERPKAYGVVGLMDSIEELLGFGLPRLVVTVLLPFKGRITHYGLVSSKPILLGPGVQRALEKDLARAEAARGVITSIDCQPERDVGNVLVR